MRSQKQRTAHFSVDDTIWLFENLGHFQYGSIFEQPTLAFFKSLHDRFGLKISFYCFGSFQGLRLCDMTDRYKAEFAANSEWMRFGFHAISDTARYIKPEVAAHDYVAVKEELTRLVGSDSIADFCRIHCYSGSKAALQAMHLHGLQGVLCADHCARTYYLTPLQILLVCLAGSYVNKRMGLHFLHTDIRVEANSMTECRNFKSRKRHIEIFTHEWALDEETRQKVEVLCNKVELLGYKWSFNEKR